MISYKATVLEHVNRDGLAVDEYEITKQDISQVYFSKHPYHQGVKKTIDLRRYANYGKVAGGMGFDIINNCLILADIVSSSPVARMPCWCTRIRGAWLRKVGPHEVQTVDDVEKAFQKLCAQGRANTTFLFLHLEVAHSFMNNGIPQVNLDQLNPRIML